MHSVFSVFASSLQIVSSFVSSAHSFIFSANVVSQATLASLYSSVSGQPSLLLASAA
jgi:hypothetical protein